MKQTKHIILNSLESFIILCFLHVVSLMLSTNFITNYVANKEKLMFFHIKPLTTTVSVKKKTFPHHFV